ncbi:MAG: hypothetical protein JST63_20220 [Bacteroidetes bacterium]|nr:hypothetical protein [Bacteroidota bacterium]
MWKLIGYILIGYVLYRFLTGFLIPVFRTGKQIKAKFSEMQDRMQQQMDQQQQDTFHSNNKSAGKTPAGDYIDFEEVK